MTRGSFFDDIPVMDRRKATKFIINGLIMAIIFGTLMMFSRSLNDNAGSWQQLQAQENKMNYNAGLYGYEEYVQKNEEIIRMYYWLQFQDVIFTNIARIGVNIAMIFIAIGFISLGVNDTLDERTRRISLILAGVILVTLMFTAFFANITVDVS